MGSLGNDAGDIKSSGVNPGTDFSRPETQPFEFDSQVSFLGDNADNKDGEELNYVQNTVRFDDNIAPMEDGFETKFPNVCGETQVSNLDGETQVLDDLDCLENMETQLLDEFGDEIVDDSDGEGTKGTDILDHGDEVFNDKIVASDFDLSLSQVEKTQSLEQYNTCKGEQLNSGISGATETPDVKAESESKPGSLRRFTSVRAASLRASGLAARNAALWGMNVESSFIRTDSQFSDQCTVNMNGLTSNVVEQINQEHCQSNNGETSIGLRHVTNSRVGCSTVRKLFAASPCSSENADAREDVLMFPAHDGSLAGLSYIDSQEPGELSQANALNFVEKLVNDNTVELDVEDDLGKSTGGKSELISCAIIGPQNLAKKTIERSTTEKTRIFDWDDALEDEGGGDIYCKRKEDFFGSASRARKTSKHPRNRKGRKLNESCNEDRPNAHDTRITDSDSKSLLCKSLGNDKPAREGKLDLRKNLLNEFDEHCNSNSSKGQLEIAAAEELDVGFDTQMAAEAMEALFYGEAATEQNGNQDFQNISKGSSKGLFSGKSRKRIASREPMVKKGVSCYDAAPVTRQSKRTQESSILKNKCSENVRKECDAELLLPKTKRPKSNTDENQVSGGIDTAKKPSKNIKQRKAVGALAKIQLHGTGRSTRGSSMKKRHANKVHTVTPIARRTRQSSVMNTQMAKSPASDCRKVKLSSLRSYQSGDHVNAKSCSNDQLQLELIAGNNSNQGLNYPKHRRSSCKMSVHVGESDDLETQSKKYVQPDDNGQQIPVVKRSRRNNRNTCIPSTTTRITRSSRNACTVPYFSDQNSVGKLSHQSSDKQGSRDDAVNCNSTEMNRRMKSTSIIGPEAAKEQHSSGNCVAVSSPIAESSTVNVASDKSPEEKSRSLGPVCTTPVNCLTPVNAASPVCMGDEYFKQSCKKKLSKASLIKELQSLNPIEPESISPLKDTRKRRDLTNVRVLFSNHLDEDIVKQQKKILTRLGISEASSILTATHFITDKFVRTRNMLEAIASGKPVVTHLWLESIGQVNIHIDEEAYVLRDIKKEKEFGFCMPASLARACKRPLLQGRRVLITPNTKPNKETIMHLVTAVHGQAIERIGRSAMKDDKVPDDLLVLSCEEDYAICVPFLEKGAAVYSSELLLNGIVTQKLEYERHRLFADHVRRTRSTIWLRKDDKFLPVTKHK
ncbi:BRCT domain-containing DNA repair protein, putative isoform 7 [Hibiscus syriacus]|uniref:BRCT domain-containing DNA repair protein, putative isoform 7 n=1 Tax=Hibiscus syriacus TaxID=106335 RepID=A0A6A3B6N9_HIBSY|nr:BRCT domain-containing DNA repair protein, putative isoform 7 [Hibiscus syriacus]